MLHDISTHFADINIQAWTVVLCVCTYAFFTPHPTPHAAGFKIHMTINVDRIVIECYLRNYFIIIIGFTPVVSVWVHWIT